uniref:Structural maintenance of chromosomes protein n=1 Tax=Bracon brevicornis TaxID=1563983 RepID=A0A6V7IYQ0_9HYME
MSSKSPLSPNRQQADKDQEEEVENDSDEEGGLRIDEDIYIPPPPRAFTQRQESEHRLIISQIINKNFKSYAGEVIIGPFNVCFSAIVGPNGSGKSNVIDAMLFVFGYRANRIRSKKISSLIHSSSEHPNCNSCTVSVHFQKIRDKADGEYEIIPDSQVIISRTAFKDSSSYYELNGRKVQFKEIARLLRNESVDLDHNRFLILQGEVEQIALMKPKGQNENDTGMLEFLEDIIGTSRYKEPLEKLMDKVEMLSEQVIEKTNRLRIAERERDTLIEPMQEAVNYLKLENKITKLQHKLYHCKKADAIDAMKDKEEAHKELESHLNELKAEVNKVHEKKEDLQKELKEKCKKWDSIQQQKDAATGKFEEIKKKDEALHADLVETNKRRKADMASIKTEQIKLQELARVPEKNAGTIQECEHLIEKNASKKEEEEKDLESLMGSLKKKTAPLMEKRAELEKQLIDHRKNVNEAKAKFNLAESELQIYTSVEQKEKEKFERLKDAVQTAAKTLQDRRENLEIFKKKIPRTEKSLHEVRTQLQELKNQEIEAAIKLKAMRVQFEESRSAMSASKSRSKVLDFLMEKKKAGIVPGLVGRLGDLGAVDVQYDIAVSTACGVLDSMVVDTVDTAERCIKLLREFDVGRAHFIALEKQAHLVGVFQRRVEFPENVPRVFDLIKVNDKSVLPAFYYGLQNTLLARDLEQGSRIAYGAQRYRVVTLQGNIIESSGAMSGGGRPMKGRIGQRVVSNEPTVADIGKLEKNLEEVFQECNRLRAKQPQLEDQIKTLQTALDEMTLNRDKFQIEVDTIMEQVPSLKQQLKIQEQKVAESKSSPERVEELNQAVEAAREILENTQETSQSVEDAVLRINDEIEEASGGKVKELQKKISDLAKAIDKARKEIVRLQVEIKTSERNTEKTKERIQQLENNVESCKTRITEIQEEKTSIEEEAKKILEQIKGHEEALKERDEASSDLRDDVAKLHKQENKIKLTIIDLNEKFKSSQTTITEFKKKIDHYEQGIRGLQLNNIPNEPAETLPELTEEQISGMDTRTIANNLAAMKERLPETIPNMQKIKDYLEKDAVFLQRSAEVRDVSAKRNKMREAYDDARKRRMEEFHDGFNTITTKLKEMYQMITMGGAAELELVDSLDPFTEGIAFSVRPPKKSWKNISNLSGGEKTLSSLALVFALHHYKPTPLYFMDEIDAALDFKNVSIVGHYIKDRTKNAQFIVVSLRNEMFELADTLVGIYKTFNATKSCTVYVKKVYTAHPEFAIRREAPRTLISLTQAPTVVEKRPQCHRMPLTCPAILKQQSQVPAIGGPNFIPSTSPLSPPTPTIESRAMRKSDATLGDKTPTTSRKSRRKSNA